MSRGPAIIVLTAAALIFQSVAATTPCFDVQIPVSVSVPRLIINATIENNWDAAALTFNLTRRDAATAAILVAGSTPEPVTSTWVVGATLCGNGGPTLVLTHGIIESKLYWRPNLDNATQYSFVDAAIEAGYSVLSYDRIGVGSSSKINAFSDAQFQVQAAVLNELVEYARNTANATKIALVGHSYGAYLTLAAASQTTVDAIVLTGYSGKFDYFAPFISGAGFRVARLQDPERWGGLDSGWLTSSDLYAETYAYFADPYFDHRVAEWSYQVASEPFGVGELLSLLQGPPALGNITAPVLMLQGQFDVSACGGDCVGLLNATAAEFTAAKAVKVVDNLPAGHSLNLHQVAPKAFSIAIEFLKTQGL